MSLFSSQLKNLILCFKKMTYSPKKSPSSPRPPAAKSSVIRGCPGFSLEEQSPAVCPAGLGGG